MPYLTRLAAASRRTYSEVAATPPRKAPPRKPPPSKQKQSKKAKQRLRLASPAENRVPSPVAPAEITASKRTYIEVAATPPQKPPKKQSKKKQRLAPAENCVPSPAALAENCLPPPAAPAENCVPSPAALASPVALASPAALSSPAENCVLKGVSGESLKSLEKEKYYEPTPPTVRSKVLLGLRKLSSLHPKFNKEVKNVFQCVRPLSGEGDGICGHLMKLHSMGKWFSGSNAKKHNLCCHSIITERASVLRKQSGAALLTANLRQVLPSRQIQTDSAGAQLLRSWMASAQTLNVQIMEFLVYSTTSQPFTVLECPYFSKFLQTANRQAQAPTRSGIRSFCELKQAV